MKSKKLSAANSKISRPNPVFFLDRSLGKHIIADALRQAGAEVRIHADQFADEEKDEVWLRAVGRQGWVVLTKDKNIRNRVLEHGAAGAASSLSRARPNRYDGWLKFHLSSFMRRPT